LTDEIKPSGHRAGARSYSGAICAPELTYSGLIVYRRLSMIDRATAQVWASWFDALGDGSRVLILNLLADAGEPLSVGEIVAALDIGQSTISHHLRRLEEVGFIICRQEGTSTSCAINEHCLEMFPTAAEVVLGRAPAAAGSADCAPWLAGDRVRARAGGDQRRG
jgi:ArsR family transcriptional regulator